MKQILLVSKILIFSFFITTSAICEQRKATLTATVIVTVKHKIFKVHPIAGATIKLLLNSNTLQTTTTNSSGVAVIPAVTAGSYQVTVESVKFENKTMNIQVREGQILGVEAQLTPKKHTNP